MSVPNCTDKCDNSLNCGPYYRRLGGAKTFKELKKSLETQFETKKIEFYEIFLCQETAMTPEGCPMYSETVERKSECEEIMVLFKTHEGHKCDNIVTGSFFEKTFNCSSFPFHSRI